MPSTRATRSSVLGKRSQRSDLPPLSTSSRKGDLQLATPESTPSPKRPRTSLTAEDGDANKENVPPISLAGNNDSTTPTRPSRALRRRATDGLINTPSRSNGNIRRFSTTMETIPATPTIEIAQLSLATPPSSPSSLLPIHSRARALLRATCNSMTSIAGRDQERHLIADFIRGSEAASSLYISGSPGTGKTALVNAVLHELEGHLDGVKILFVNCMALNNIDALWDRLSEDLTSDTKGKSPGRTKKVKGRDSAERLLASIQSKCILILDELDHIASTTSTLTTIFSLPASSPLLRLIGIANTHTLTSSISHLPSTANVQTVHFSPYNPAQLFDILDVRLSSLCDDTAAGQAARTRFLPKPALTLLTKKVAAMTGDVRSLFEVLRSAIDLSIMATDSASLSALQSNPEDIPGTTVTPAHILAALKAHTPSSKASPATTSAPAIPSTSNSDVVNKIRGMGLHPRIVLLSIIIATKRLEAGLLLADKSPGSPLMRSSRAALQRSPSLPFNALPFSSSSIATPRIDVAALYTFYAYILSHGQAGAIAAVSRSELGDLLSMLEVAGLIEQNGSAGLGNLSGSPSKSKRTFGRSASFGGVGKGKGATGGADIKLVEGVRTDEVLRGLGVNAAKPSDAVQDVDAREEEVGIIWERECRRMAKDASVAEKRARAAKFGDAFDDAMED